jgi:LuxR family transcriptional regulator, maltose regulon positive regulatory protein
MKAVSDGLELSRTSGIHFCKPALLAHAILSSLNINDSQTARQLLEELASGVEKPELSGDLFLTRDRHIYHFMSAREALIRGDLGQALLHIDPALKFGMETGSPVIIGWTHALRALIKHSLGKNSEAIEELDRTSDIAHQMKSNLLEFNVLLSRAQFAFDEGNESSGLALLRKALTLGRDQRMLSTHLDQPSATASLCVKALEAGIEVEYVQETIQRRRLIPDKPPLHLENWPWPLTIYTSGRFGIVKDGKPIRFSRKTRERPLFMLKALIALGGREVREEDLSDILWPEADGDAAHNSFETTLHRLRTLIGYPDALQFHDGRLTLDSKYCWVDAWAFERLLGEVDGKQKETWTEDSISLAQKAIGMYRGTFLAKEIEQSWLISIRERLRSKFLRNVNRLGDYWCQTKQWGKALECYQKGLEVDDLAEEFCQGLMICYQNLGLKANALSQYNRFEKRLKAVLGIEPSPKTKTLRDTLLMKSRRQE